MSSIIENEGSESNVHIPELKPGLRPGEVPRFSELGEYLFQDLCRDIYYEEEGVNDCEVFGKRGQAQYGADLVANIKDYESSDIIQCKAYAEVKKGDIKKACEKFLNDFSKWEKYKVRRFILIFGCTCDNTQHFDEIKDQIPRFKAHSINFEVWSSPKLLAKLSKHPEIVGRYFRPSEYWKDYICGNSHKAVSPSIETITNSTSVLISNVLMNQVEAVTKSLSDATGKSLDIYISRWKEGRLNETLEWLKEIKERDWTLLNNDLKAKILRLEASVCLDMSKPLSEVEAIAEEARKICPEANDSRLRALIFYHKKKIDDAIITLQGQEGINNANMLAAFLLQKGEIEKALGLLFSSELEKLHNTESFRLLSIAYLIQGKIEFAESYIQKALKLSPNWSGIKFVYACVEYYKAIAPSMLPDKFIGWPEAVDMLMVKGDLQSVQALKNAHRIFNELLESEEDISRKDCYQLWCGACLLNIADDLEVGTKLISLLVNKEVAGFFAVSWILTRNLPVNIEDCIQSILLDDLKDPSQVISVVMLYLQAENPRKAIALLNEKKVLFEFEGLIENWHFWLSQSYINANESELALSLIETEKDFKFEVVRLLAYKKIDRESKGKSQKALTFVRKCYRKSKAPYWLLELSSLLFLHKKWRELSEIAEALVESLQTVQALQTSLIALFNNREYRKCIEVLERFSHILIEDKLPSKIREIKVFSLKQIGRFPVAIKEAELLVREEPSTRNILNIFQLYFEKGDAVRLRLYGEELSKKTDLKDSEKLLLSLNLLTHDKELSRKFFLSINLKRISDQEVTTAMTLSYKLGIEETNELIQRLGHLAKKGKSGLRLINLKDLQKYLKQSSEKAERLNNMYCRGVLPIHMVAPSLNFSMADIYHSGATFNKVMESSRNWRPLLYFHGGRNYEAPAKKLNETSVVLDISSFLNAEHFNFLDELELAFEKLLIPQALPLMLSHIKDSYIPNQMTRVSAIETVIDLYQNKSIRLADEFTSEDPDVDSFGLSLSQSLKWSEANNGLIVEFYPPSLGLDKKIKKDALRTIESNLIDFYSLAEFLLVKALISQKEFDTAISKLPLKEFSDRENIILKQGQRLILPGTIPEVLATAGILKPICSFFSVYVQRRELNRIEQEMRQFRVGIENQAWIDRLQKRISNGIDKEKYEFFTHPLPTPTKALESAILEGFLARTSQGDEFVVCDDRMTNSYQRVDQSPILESYDIIKVLAKHSFLDQDKFNSIVLEMRNSGVMFIKHDSNETIHYLRKASVEDSRLLETKELAIIRRYYAGMMLKLNYCYQKPGSSQNMPNPHGEASLLMNLAQMAHDALMMVWNDETIDSNRKVIESNWIMRNLYVSFPGIHSIVGTEIDDENSFANLSLSLSWMLTRALQLDNSKSRKDYLQWVSRFIYEKTERSKLQLELICQTFKNLFISIISRKDADFETITLLFYRILQDLPEKIRKAIESDLEFLEKVGLKINHFVSFSDYHFYSDEFWNCVGKVLNYETQKLTDSQKKSEFNLSLNESGSIVFTNEKDGFSLPVYFHEFEFLKNNANFDELFVPNDWFDASREEISLLKNQFLEINSTAERANLVQRWMQNGLAGFYNSLNQKIKASKSIDFSELFPDDLSFMLKSYRFNVNDNSLICDVFSSSVKKMLEVSLEAALYRFLTLPIPLPLELIEALSSLGREERRNLFKKILRFSGSPVTKSQLCRLLLSFIDDPLLVRFGKRVLSNSIGKNSLPEANAFLALLKWVYGELQNFKIRNDFVFVLTWAHTSNLFAILKANNVDLGWMKDHFSSNSKLSWLELFRDSDLYLDCLHPNNLNPECLVYKLFSNSVNGNLFIASQLNFKKDLSSLFLVGTDKKVLVPAVMPLLKGYLNITNSFIGYNLTTEFAEIFPEEGDFFINKTFLNELIEDCKKNKLTATNLLYISLFIDSLFSNKDFRDVIYEIISVTDFDLLLKENPQTTLYSFIELSEFSFRSMNPAFAEKIYLKFKEINKSFLDLDGSSENLVNSLLNTLLEVVLYTSLAVEPYSPKSFSLFSEKVKELGFDRPSVFVEMKDIIEQMTAQASAIEEKSLWSLVLLARSS